MKLKFLLVTNKFFVIFVTSSIILEYCDGIEPTPVMEIATTPNSINGCNFIHLLNKISFSGLMKEKEFVSIFDSNHNYNDSLLYPESTYYQYLKEYYESTALEALQNTTTSNFLVTNVTVLAFK